MFLSSFGLVLLGKRIFGCRVCFFLALSILSLTAIVGCSDSIDNPDRPLLKFLERTPTPTSTPVPTGTPTPGVTPSPEPASPRSLSEDSFLETKHATQ